MLNKLIPDRVRDDKERASGMTKSGHGMTQKLATLIKSGAMLHNTIRTIIILSESEVIMRSLKDNLHHEGELNTCSVSNLDLLKKYDVIDILIYDFFLQDPSSVPFYKIRTLINLSQQQLSQVEIKLIPPLHINELLSILRFSLRQNSLFIPFSTGCIYDERDASLKFKDRKISFTEKENAILAYLLKHSPGWVTKYECYAGIWGNDSSKLETTTIETHLQNLKGKLPEGLLEMQGGNIRFLYDKTKPIGNPN